MDAKAESGAYNVVYEDIEPFFEWHSNHDSHVLVLLLPGFRRDQLKIQVTSAPILKISAQRQIGGNRWRRVYKEFSIPSDCNSDEIAAKFEAGTLKINFPRLISPSSKSPERDDDAEKNGAKLEDPAKLKSDGQVSDATQKVDEPARDDDLTKEKGKTDDGGSEKNTVRRQEDFTSADEVSGKTKQKEKEAAAASDGFAKEKGKINNGVHEKSVVHQEGQEKAKSGDEVSGKTPSRRTNNVPRLKTRLLDFTLSLRPPSSAAEQEDYYKKAVADLVARLKKMKNLMNLVVAFLVVAFVLYVKNAYKPSLEGLSEEQEL
ncbi:inactive protein RESTRICTED TEV MOVEMENT 2-like [Prosopis cineraria]|uniref:inactive protein RESTRICTED TEV MOVEMENT 2-like n=1 Tax=Prosopis cineraria TaxID=364024 RepID=UPI00240F5C35|nr:inactive protein RESTRICTED TEV MOVEMENT 2-like [Prosopis cineraria]XP_054797011.1 inactive protein RESTRICTED TEV MOVEMENT 2-like [Prosopis cineraria]